LTYPIANLVYEATYELVCA